MTFTFDPGMIAILMAVGNLVLLVYTAGVRLGRIELQVATMWEMLLKGALVDARRAGVLEAHSPFRLATRVTTALDNDFGARLREFYRTAGLQEKTDSEAVLLLARAFEDEVIERVCLQLGLNFGAALVAVLQYCREGAVHAES